jgi:hypothetical protein
MVPKNREEFVVGYIVVIAERGYPFGCDPFGESQELLPETGLRQTLPD